MAFDVAEAIAAVAAIGAVVFAAIQYRHAVKERNEGIQTELDGVAVEWHPLITPNRADPDGTAVWQYEVSAHNPGRLPIKKVTIYLHFPVEVRRQHFDGSLDNPTSTLKLPQPVIVGGGKRTWVRTIRLQFSDKPKLHLITADIVFTTLKGESRTNHMEAM